MALMSALLGVPGCATWGSYTPEVAPVPAFDAPPQWSDIRCAVAPCTEASAQWWRRFNDALLADLVAAALRANTGVLSARAAVQQARALRDVAAAALAPGLGSSGSVQKGSSGGRSTGTNFRLGLDASWEADLFGAQRSGLRASQAAADARDASLGDVQLVLAGEVALAYIQLRSAQARLTIAADNLASQLQTLQLTQWRAQAGLVSALEVEQALGAAAQTRARLPAQQTSIDQTRHVLAVLTGQAPAALDAMLARPGALPHAAADLALGIPADTLRQRPDVRAAELGVDAALARVAQAQAQRAPSVRVSASLGLSALTLGGLGATAAVASALAASVQWPLFDGGAGQAQVSAQHAALEVARAAYLGTALAALKDVEDALAALRGDALRRVELMEAARAAASAALLARQRFDSGLIDFQTVLETQRNQLAAQDNVAGVSAELSAGQVRLFKALGGGWRRAGDAAGDAAAGATGDAPATQRISQAAAQRAPQGRPRPAAPRGGQAKWQSQICL